MTLRTLAAFRGAVGINAFWPLGGPQVIMDAGSGQLRPRPMPGTFLFADGPPALHFRPEVLSWVSDAGFDHIRIQYEPMTIMWAIEHGDTTFLAQLLDYFEDCVTRIMAAGIGVVLSGILAGYANIMLLDSVFAGKTAARYIIYKQHLQKLCERFAHTDPRLFCLELLNEPPGNGSTVVRDHPNWGAMYTGNWATDYQPELYALVRAAMPRHSIICTSDGWSNWETLTQLNPGALAADHNIIWTYHPLFPTPVSLAGFVYNQYFYVQRLRFPPGAAGQTMAESIAAMIALVDKYPEVATNGDPAATKAGLTYDLNRYYNDPQGWDWIQARCNDVTTWARSYGIPPGNVYAGEWGFTRDSTGFPGNILGTALGSHACTRLDIAHGCRAMTTGIINAGQRRAVDHLDTLNYGVTMAQNNKVGPFDTLVLRALSPRRALLMKK